MPDDEPDRSNESPQKSETPDAEPAAESTKQEPPASDGRIKRFFQKYWAKKKLTIPLTLFILVLIILAVPFTRYKVLGLFIKRNFSATIVDAQTGRPVSEAKVSIGGQSAHTNGEGEAAIKKVPIGQHELTITKKYYQKKSQDVTVGFDNTRNKSKFTLKATGRAVQLKVTNKISGKPLADVSIKVLDTQAKTNDKGETTIVLPADKDTEKAMLTAKGYNDLQAEIVVTGQAHEKNTITLTPSGKIYFLSKASGNIDVVSTNLDGSGSETVLAGTGHELDHETVLLASQDWKYLALRARREGEHAKLYLIETATGKLTVMDEGDAVFNPVGWHEHDFVYHVNRLNIKSNQPKREALKTYNADAQSIATLDETGGGGTDEDFNYFYENFSYRYITKDGVLYTKTWYATWAGDLHDRQAAIAFVNFDGSNKRNLKTFPAASTSINVTPYAPNEFYITINQNGAASYFEYEDGAVEAKDADSVAFSRSYPTYLFSPSKKQVFWTEDRDGKTVLLVGNAAAENPEEIARLSGFEPYGWYTDNYLLVSKDSELYILAKEKGATPLEISGYHRPSYPTDGYGYGYGGGY